MTERATENKVVVEHLNALFDGPLMVSEQHMPAFVYCVQQLVGSKDYHDLVLRSAQADDGFWDESDWRVRAYRPYRVEGGILTIPVQGAMVNRFSYQMGSYATGYQYIERALERGLMDPGVKGIALDMHTPGGDVSGLFELAGMVAGAKKEKPVQAYANDIALSAGYAIASASSKVTVSRSGHTGSVGVVAAHVDISEALEAGGIKITLIYAGKHKVDGNPFQALSKQARDRIQASVDKTYDRFVTHVAENRGMTYDSVQQTEALVYDADDSVAIGFADQVGDYRAEVQKFAVSLGGITTMTGQTDDQKADTGEQKVDTEAVKAEAVKAERKRFQDVNASEEFKGREQLANHLLAETDMSAEQIIATLAVSPKTVEVPKQEGAGRNHFEEAMKKQGSPDVGADDDAGDTEDDGVDEFGRTANARMLLSNFARLGGKVRERKPTTH